jgi:hypothetical protein
MNFCPSAIATAAIFTAIIINDFINSNYTPITLHLLGGIFVTLGIMTLCQRVGDYAGWFLLLIPIFIILIGFFLEWYSSSSSDKLSYGPSSGPCIIPCSSCGYCNPCRCRRRRTRCPTGTTTMSPVTIPGTTQVIGSDLPKNTQTSTLGKNC